MGGKLNMNKKTGANITFQINLNIFFLDEYLNEIFGNIIHCIVWSGERIIL